MGWPSEEIWRRDRKSRYEDGFNRRRKERKKNIDRIESKIRIIGVIE